MVCGGFLKEGSKKVNDFYALILGSSGHTVCCEEEEKEEKALVMTGGLGSVPLIMKVCVRVANKAE